MHLFNTNRAQTAAYIGRALVPGSVHAAGNGLWHRLSATTGFGWASNDRPGATEVRLCLTYSDSATTADAPLQVRLRRTDNAGGTVFFSDTWPITWSETGLYHHRCGAWHSLSAIICGYSWGDTCQVDWLHSPNIWVYIKSVELEFGSSNPNEARTFRGRLDVPSSQTFTPITANSWKIMSRSIGFVNSQYPDAKYVRVCVVFTDSSSGSTASVRLIDQSWKKTVYFEDNIGGTWSSSGLTHSECGAWHPFGTVRCGFSWGNTCRLELKSTAAININIFEVDLELKGAALS